MPETKRLQQSFQLRMNNLICNVSEIIIYMKCNNKTPKRVHAWEVAVDSSSLSCWGSIYTLLKSEFQWCLKVIQGDLIALKIVRHVHFYL